MHILTICFLFISVSLPFSSWVIGDIWLPWSMLQGKNGVDNHKLTQILSPGSVTSVLITCHWTKTATWPRWNWKEPDRVFFCFPRREMNQIHQEHYNSWRTLHKFLKLPYVIEPNINSTKSQVTPGRNYFKHVL